MDEYELEEMECRDDLEAPLHDFRAASEDDDGYDPYSDYMDSMAWSGEEDLCEDPWR